MIQKLFQCPFFKSIAIIVLVAFISMIPAQSGYAQVAMAKPGQMVPISPRFTPAMMMGVKVDVKDPFNLSFVMGNGQNKMTDASRKEEFTKLIKYFMASLITPNEDMWVNLSPKEADRIIPENFSLTEMGRDLLAQDYLLKQFTASLMHPDGEVGRAFWKKIYQKAYATYGTTDIPVDTFNKVWITADKADIYQKEDTAILVNSHLKVMLEEDFKLTADHQTIWDNSGEDTTTPGADNAMVMGMVRDVLLPVIEKEVNEGENFATVRQVYNSMILATWFKMALKQTLLGQVYADQNKVLGIAIDDPKMKDRIYIEYLKAYKKGVFNFIKEEMDELSKEVLPRRYFSGGIVGVDQAMINILPTADAARSMLPKVGDIDMVRVTLENVDGAQFVPVKDAAQKDAQKKDNASRLSKLGAYIQQIFQNLSEANDELSKKAKAKQAAETRELYRKSLKGDSEKDSGPSLFSWLIGKEKRFKKAVLIFYGFAFLHGAFAALPGSAVAFDDLTVVKEVKMNWPGWSKAAEMAKNSILGSDVSVELNQGDFKTAGASAEPAAVKDDVKAGAAASNVSETPLPTKQMPSSTAVMESSGVQAKASSIEEKSADGVAGAVTGGMPGPKVFDRFSVKVTNDDTGYKPLAKQTTLKFYDQNGSPSWKTLPAGTPVKFVKVADVKAAGVDGKFFSGVYPNKQGEVIASYQEKGEASGDTVKLGSKIDAPSGETRDSLIKSVKDEVKGMKATASKEADPTAKGNLKQDPFNTDFKVKMSLSESKKPEVAGKQTTQPASSRYKDEIKKLEKAIKYLELLIQKNINAKSENLQGIENLKKLKAEAEQTLKDEKNAEDKRVKDEIRMAAADDKERLEMGWEKPAAPATLKVNYKSTQRPASLDPKSEDKMASSVQIVPSADKVAHLDHLIAKKKIDISNGVKKGLPVNGQFATGYNAIDGSLAIGGGENTFNIVFDVPFRDGITLGRIGQGISSFSTQSLTNQIGGPLFAGQILSQLRNYVVMHKTQGQDVRFDANVTLASGLLQTVTVHIVPIESFDQNNEPVTEYLVSIGLVDTLQATLGVIDGWLGNTGFLGDSNKSFVTTDLGYQIQHNQYHLSFNYWAANNKNKNDIFIKTYELSKTDKDENGNINRYRKNDRNGWKVVDGNEGKDGNLDYRSATVRGFVMHYDPETNQMKGEQVFAAPTYVTDRFVENLTEEGQDASVPLVERMPSIEDLEQEKMLARGTDQDGRVILGALRHFVTGRIDRFITDPKELNALNGLTDKEGHKLDFIRGNSPSASEGFDSWDRIGKDYVIDEFGRVYHKWADWWYPSTDKEKFGETYDPSRSVPLMDMPGAIEDRMSPFKAGKVKSSVKKSLFLNDTLIFDPSLVMKEVSDVGNGPGYLGIVYFNDGRMPTPYINKEGVDGITVEHVFDGLMTVEDVYNTVERSTFEKKITNGGAAFDWLMKNNYFKEKSGTEVHPENVTDLLMPALEKRFSNPKELALVVDILQHPAAYKKGTELKDATRGVALDKDGKHFKVKGFEGKSLDPKSLVVTDDQGVVVGILALSQKGMDDIITNAKAANDRMSERNDGLNQYGVGFDVKEGKPFNLTEPLYDYTTAKNAGVVGQVIKMKDADGNMKELRLTPEMMVKLDDNKQVGWVMLRAGMKAVNDRLVIVKTLADGGWQVKHEGGNDEIYANTNNLSKEQQALKVNPEKKLVEMIAANRAVIKDRRENLKEDGTLKENPPELDAEGKPLKEMVILKEPATRPFPDAPVEMANTLKQFHDRNVLVIAKGEPGKEPSQYVSKAWIKVQDAKKFNQSLDMTGPAYKDSGIKFRGVTYSPIPDGKDRKNWSWNTVGPEEQARIINDIKKFKELGVNSIRVYSPIINDAILKALNEAKIAVVVNIPNHDDRSVPAAEKYDLKTGTYLKFVKDHFGKYPPNSVLEFGNENNYHANEWFGGNILTWYDALEKAAQEIHKVNPNIIVASAHGEVPAPAVLERVPSVDWWGINVYRQGGTVEAAKQFLETVKQTSGANKGARVYFSEVGASAWNSATQQVDEQKQANELKAILSGIASIKDPRFAGTMVMTFNNEDWKKHEKLPEDLENSPDALERKKAEPYFGLVGQNGQENAAYVVVKETYNSLAWQDSRPSEDVARPVVQGIDLSKVKEIKEIGENGAAVGFMVKKLDGSRVTWSTVTSVKQPESELDQQLKENYLIIYNQDITSKAPVFATLAELKDKWEDIRKEAWGIKKLKTITDPEHEDNTVSRIYFGPKTEWNDVVIGTVGVHLENGKEVSDPDVDGLYKIGADGSLEPDGTAVLKNTIELKGVPGVKDGFSRVVEHRGNDGNFISAIGVVVPEDAGTIKELPFDQYKNFGNLDIEFFGQKFKAGSPDEGIAIVGYREGERGVYKFTVVNGKYHVDFTKKINVAKKVFNIKFSQEDKERLNLWDKSTGNDKNFVIAGLFDNNDVFEKAFIVDSDTNKEIGQITPSKHGFSIKGGEGATKQNYHVEILNANGERETYVMEGAVSGSIGKDDNVTSTFSFKQKVSTSADKTKISADTHKSEPVALALSELQAPLGKELFGKLQVSAERIANEVGIQLKDMRLVPSEKKNEGNGINVFYRLAGDPLARVIVFQSTEDVHASSFQVNTDFDGKTAVKSYEKTLTNKFRMHVTSKKNLSKSELEEKWGFNKVEDFSKYKGTLAYEHFNDIIEITTYELPNGINDESIQDPVLVRYMGAGDPFALDLVKKEQGKVRLMRYDDDKTLWMDVVGNDGQTKKVMNRPFTVTSGEVALLPSEGLVMRETHWKEHDQVNHKYAYNTLFEQNSSGVFNNPNITIDFYYKTAIVAERFFDESRVYYSLNGEPLVNRYMSPSFWYRVNPLNLLPDSWHWLDGLKQEKVMHEESQSGFRVTVERVGDLVFRLVQEVNIPGATQKDDLRSTLYINDVPVALEKGSSINLSVFPDRVKDIMRNGISGAFLRSVGVEDGNYLGFTIKVPGYPEQKVDLKEKIDYMKGLKTATVEQKKEIEKVNNLISQKKSIPEYTNVLKDIILKPWALLAPVLAAVFLSVTAGWKWRNRNIRMNAPRLSALEELQKGGKKALMPKGLAAKWTVFIATRNAVAVMHEDKEVAAANLRHALVAAGEFFTPDEIQSLVSLLRSGKISFDDVDVDPLRDRDAVPAFDIRQIIGDVAQRSDALPVAAMRHAFEKGWFDQNELQGWMDEVKQGTRWNEDVGDKWVRLFAIARERLFAKAVVSGDFTKVFPDPEVVMYQALVAKGYTDIRAYVLDGRNGSTTKQRLESYVRVKILEPMTRQMYQEIPFLGDEMKDLRKAPLENAVISEFYRYVMLDPRIMPAATMRTSTADGVITYNPAVFDVVYNPNPALKYSEPVTFREKLVFNLLAMPLSETHEISLGSLSGMAPMSVFLTRYLVRKLRAAETTFAGQSDDLIKEKKAIVTEFAYHIRFWIAVFQTGNFGAIFGSGQIPGLFKRIAEPGGNNPGFQPKLAMKEIFADETLFDFFDALAEEEDATGKPVYEDMMLSIMSNDELLLSRLGKAVDLLDKSIINKYFADEKDRKKLMVFYQKFERLGDEVDSLVNKHISTWSSQERMRAAALSSESLFWELMTIKYNVDDNKKLEAFVHGSYTQLMSPIFRKNNEYRLFKNSYGYLANELTTTSKGHLHYWFFRRIALKYGMGLTQWWLERKLGGMAFKVREFNETVKAVDLLEKIRSAEGKQDKAQKALSEDEAVNALNKYVTLKTLHLHPAMQKDSPEAASLRAELSNPKLNQKQRERLNRRLIEENLSLETPKSLEFIDKDGKKNYSEQNSLRDFWGIKSKAVRYGIVAARVILTPLAAFLAFSVSAGLGAVVFSVAWGLLPLIFGHMGKTSERLFNISIWSATTAAVGLLAHLVLGKMALSVFMAFGTYVTLGLWLMFIPLIAMGAYQFVGFFVAKYMGEENIWDSYWLSRTVGWWSLLMVRPIRNISWVKKNFAGEFNGKMVRRLLDVQRSRGSILPANVLVQDKLIEDFRLMAKNTRLSPGEMKANVAAVEFMARHHDGVTANDPAWPLLVASARAYEEARLEIGKEQGIKVSDRYVKMSDEALMKLKRPFVLVNPRDQEAQDMIYFDLRTMVMNKPNEDVFAVLQGVSSMEHAFGEVTTFMLEQTGALGTHNIAGAREFLPKLRKEFRMFLKNKGLKISEILKKDSGLERAYTVDAYPLTLKSIVDRLAGKLEPDEKAWVEARLNKAREDGVIAETSLLGYVLRENSAALENMLASLVQKDKRGEFVAFRNAFIYVTHTSDVRAMFQAWVKDSVETLYDTREEQTEVIRIAAEALASFINEFLPNNGRVLENYAEDVYYVHLAAAASYGDFEYYNQARELFSRYHSLALAAEQPDVDAGFKEKFKHYQNSAKLKTVGTLQFPDTWATGPDNQFRHVAQYETQADFDPDVINISEYPFEWSGYGSLKGTVDGLMVDVKIQIQSQVPRQINPPEFGPFNNTLKGVLADVERSSTVVTDDEIVAMLIASVKMTCESSFAVQVSDEVVARLTTAFRQELERKSLVDRLREAYKAAIESQPGIKIATTIEGTRTVVFAKEMRNVATALIKFRQENYEDILSLPLSHPLANFLLSTNEMMVYIEKSAQADALVPVYDKRKDDIIPGTKNSCIDWHIWTNFGRIWNRDAGIMAYPGHSIYRLLFATLMGRKPSTVIGNPVFQLWGADSFPGVAAYQVAISTFSDIILRLWKDQTLFYGKGGGHPAAMLALYSTPVEDSLNFLKISARRIVDRFWQPSRALERARADQRSISTSIPWMMDRWARPVSQANMKATEGGRYPANTIQLEMATGFDVNLNPSVPVPVKLTNHRAYNHYHLVPLAVLLMLLLPGLQGWSGFAYLEPKTLFLPLTFVAMEIINIFNTLRHWERSGSIAVMTYQSMNDIRTRFAYFVNMLSEMPKTIISTANEVFKFARTNKTIIFNYTTRKDRFNQDTRMAWLAQTSDKTAKSLKYSGVASILGGTLMAVLMGLKVAWISQNFVWLGYVMIAIGIYSFIMGKVLDYRHVVNAKGENSKPLLIPFDSVVFLGSSLSWVVGVFFTKTAGPIVTGMYLLASIALLTGGYVYDTFTRKEKGPDGKDQLLIKGENHWAILTDKPAALAVFVAALGAATGLKWLAPTILAMAGVTISPWVFGGIYAVAAISLPWAFGNYFEAFGYAFKDVFFRYSKDLNDERKNRRDVKVELAKAKKAAEDLAKKPSSNKTSENDGAQREEIAKKDAAQLVEIEKSLHVAQTRIEALDRAAVAFSSMKKFLEARADNAAKPANIAKPDDVGGISLSEKNLTINIKVDGNGMPLPVNMQDPAMVNIQGLVPVIRDIEPVNAVNMPVVAQLLKSGA